jgi:histidinol dehydrogenase
VFSEIETWDELSPDEQSALLQRPALADDHKVRAQAAEIIAAVRRDGDEALFRFARQFEGRDISALRVSATEFQAAEAALTDESRAAVDLAIANVRRFHEAQEPAAIDVTISSGVRCERRSQPIDAVGLYVPAGTAPLPSTVVMLAVPASIAGCPVRILCSPADKEGKINAATLYAARRGGIKDVFKIGGSQAIAAMAYGTETVPRVDRIFGPGNTWVTTAKSIVASDPAGASIDMPAGPSEVLVIADASANPAFVASDLLSQAEHGPDSQVLLVTTSRNLAAAVIGETARQLELLERNEIAREALRHSHIIVAADVDAAIAISNRYAPEHLLVQVENPRACIDKIRNAGSVFLGSYTPESVGDYCSGTNHVLPTYGAARSYSGLGVEQFMRQMTVQELTEDGLRSLAPAVIELATLEGLDAHAAAVRIRLDDAINMRAVS